MKQRIYFTTLALCISATCLAQFSIGVQGGVLFSSVQSSLSEDEGANFPFQSASYSGDRGFHYSIPVAYRFSSYFSLQGELVYQRFGYQKTQIADLHEQFMHKIKLDNRIRMNYFYTNLLIKISTGVSRFRLHLVAGPSVGISTSGHVEHTETDFYQDGFVESRWRSKSFSAKESTYTRNDLGWIVGAGVTLSLSHYDVFLEARQYTSVREMSTIEKLRNTNRTIHLGVLFPL